MKRFIKNSRSYPKLPYTLLSFQNEWHRIPLDLRYVQEWIIQN